MKCDVCNQSKLAFYVLVESEYNTQELKSLCVDCLVKNSQSVSQRDIANVLSYVIDTHKHDIKLRNILLTVLVCVISAAVVLRCF